MAKYDFNFKMKVVKSYLNREEGLIPLSKKYVISNKSQVHRWINEYNSLGEEGLKRKIKDNGYTTRFKLDVNN